MMGIGIKTRSRSLGLLDSSRWEKITPEIPIVCKPRISLDSIFAGLRGLVGYSYGIDDGAQRIVSEMSIRQNGNK